MNKKPDSYSQPRLDSISESSDRTEFLSTKSTEPIMAIVTKDGQHHPRTEEQKHTLCRIMLNFRNEAGDQEVQRRLKHWCNDAYNLTD